MQPRKRDILKEYSVEEYFYDDSSYEVLNYFLVCKPHVLSIYDDDVQYKNGKMHVIWFVWKSCGSLCLLYTYFIYFICYVCSYSYGPVLSTLTYQFKHKENGNAKL